MAKKKRTLLIDGDVIAFECCISNEMEIEWEEDLWVLYSDASECRQRFEQHYGKKCHAILPVCGSQRHRFCMEVNTLDVKI